MYRRNPDVVMRTIHGSVFLIDICDHYAGDRCALYEINETGRFLWEHLDETGTVEGLADALSAVLLDPVPMDVLRSDAEEFIRDLVCRHFVQEAAVHG